jgi:two-component system, NtrC family, response regulator HydG
VRQHRSLLDVPDQVRPLHEIEREYILAALERNHGHRSRTARQLKIGSATLFRKLKEYADHG